MPQPLRIALMLFAALGLLGLIAASFLSAFRRSADPVGLLIKWIITLLIVGGFGWLTFSMRDSFGAVTLPFLAVGIAIVFSYMWAPSVAGALFSSITNAFDGGAEEIDAAPLYST